MLGGVGCLSIPPRIRPPSAGKGSPQFLYRSGLSALQRHRGSPSLFYPFFRRDATLFPGFQRIFPPTFLPRILHFLIAACILKIEDGIGLSARPGKVGISGESSFHKKTDPGYRGRRFIDLYGLERSGRQRQISGYGRRSGDFALGTGDRCTGGHCRCGGTDGSGSA